MALPSDVVPIDARANPPGDPVAAPAGLRIEVPLIRRSTSRVGYGTGGLLRIGSARLRQSALGAALASGITHFDTAPIYGLGEAERSLGRFLKGRRREVTVTTKFGLRASVLATRLAPLQRAGRRAMQLLPSLKRMAVRSSAMLYAAPCFSASAVRASLEASLRALRTDYVDFYLAHQASPVSMPDEELIELLQGLRRTGKILAFGIATDFENVVPVLDRRPQLARVVQFDRDPSRGDLPGLDARPKQLLITYGLLRRSLALCRVRCNGTASAQDHRRFARLDDETLGGMLLRAAVLANPNGIVLMQSRSSARIERNARAATDDGNDEHVRALVRSLSVIEGYRP